MKRKIAKWTNALRVVVAFMLVLSFSFADLGSVKADGGASASRITISGGLKETELETDSLRQQYFNQSTISANETVSYEGKRWVIAELEGDSLYESYEKSSVADSFQDYLSGSAATKLKASLEKSHEKFLSVLNSKGIDYTYKYSYTVLNNGVAIKISANDYEKVSNLSGVKNVYFSENYAVPEVAVTNNANVYSTGIYDSSDLDYKGEGMVVAILDTGLDYSHEAFQTMPDEPAWTKTTVANKLAAIKESGKPFYAKASVDEVYYNAKVPFAYDYADDDPDVYPSYSSHGTHVAGIVAGQSDYVVATADDGTEETFLGVAPQAQLVIGKVFTDNLDSDSLGGADTVDIISAVSDCVALGVDVINMSLGSSAGFAREEDDEFLNAIYDSVEAAGISLVVAASNDYSSGFGGGNGTNLASNPDSGTVGSPSTYKAALSVASINGQKSTYIQANDDEDQVAFITEASDGDGNDLDFVDQLYKIAGKPKGTTLNFKYVVVSGVGRPANYSGRVARELADKEGYDGTIALVKRGDITFAEKVQNAMDNDADACIIYNNLSGTIRMSLGDVNEPIPTCAITMDAGKVIVDAAVRNVGTIQVSSEFKAGPFMSDFSSWGPMPDLQLKPEISAHGGEITSAVPGGYDIYSGTSMAAPNMAGAISLLRQYLKTANPELTGPELNARVNQVLMSTATIALNEEGNPYSPRKQGAGLAGIADAIGTESYITVKDENGNVRDKTKIELYDDKTRTGVYEFEFAVNNITDKAQSYNPVVYVMTETLASDKKTVAEKAYMLSDSKIELTVNGAAHSGELSVPANGSVNVKIKITLSAAAKNYIDASFENGMYIEGFVSLQATNDTKVTVGLPYLAFYGDWNDAPLFDYSSYEIAESEKDTGIPAEDKLVASAVDTKVIGMYYDDQYILAMGAYLYEMQDSDVKIYPDKDKIAVSIFDEENERTIYELYMVYAGLLRGALYMDVEIKEADSGNVIYSERQYNISKSYAAGGSLRSAPITLEIKPNEWNLENNKQYYVSLKGALAYEGGENPERNTFDFTFTVDYEAPQVLDYRVRFDPYTENKKTKYRIYMDVDVYDNQYVQDVMPCYIKSNPDSGKNVLTLATEYPIPVYGSKGTKSTVSFDITDIYEDYVKTGKLYLAVEDYAMNQVTYNVVLDQAIEYPDSVTVTSDKESFVNTEENGMNTDGKTEYPVYQVVLSPNELFTPTVTTTPDALIAQTLAWSIESGTEFVKANGGEIFAVKNGKATAVLKNVSSSDTNIYAKIEIAVSGEALSAPIADKMVIDPLLNGKGYVVNVSEGTSNTLDMNPNQTAKLIVSVSPWYIDGVEFSFKSQNEAVAKVDPVTGEITAIQKGTTSIEITASGDNVRLPSKWVKVVVGDYYRIVNYTLYDYYGGPVCEIPKDKNVMYIDDECFQYNTQLTKVILPSTVTELPENAFKGCVNLEEVVIPSQCTVIKESAFAGCRSLKKVVLGVFVDRDNIEHPDYSGAITLGKNVFNGCRSLVEIENSLRITTALDGAFEKCTSLESIDISGLRVTGKGVFKGCTKLSEVITSEFTNIGKEMFLNCTSLVGFEFKGTYLNDGAFNGCSSLASFKFSPSGEFLGIGENALAGTSIANVVLPDGEYSISENAFNGCKKLISVVLGEKTVIKESKGSPFAGCDSFTNYSLLGNDYYSVKDGVLYSKDGATIVSVPTAKKNVEIPSSVKKIASGAFAGSQITSADLSGIESIGEYAFTGSKIVSVTFGAITEIPAGLFRSCRSLTSVTGLDSVEKIGEYAFMYSAITSLDLPNVTEIGEYAFKDCKKLVSVTAGEVSTIGKYAFEGSGVKAIDFACATSIGDNAFANTSSLQTAVLGGVTEAGERLFVGSSVKNVTFGAGTKAIADYAFYGVTALETITLPDGVEEIGAFAFSGVNKLASVNLSGTKIIGEYAFLNATSLKNADLSSVVKIGNGAMSYTAIVKADLSNAEYVGDFAFMDDERLTEVTFGALKYVGQYAFSDTRLTSVTLPESFDDVNSIYTWEKIDEKGRVEKVRERNVSSFGEGAFANIPTLTSIEANGNVIYDVDGVLYAKEENGLVLLQYPAAKQLDTYTVETGTVAIASSAFEGVNALESVIFPYTLKTIGSYAFYKSSVEVYTFNSVEAPTLLSEFVDVTSASVDSIEKLIFGRGSSSYLGSTVFYANFHDYVAKLIYKDAFTNYNPSEFGLTAIVPKNGTGYDTEVWTNFFTVEKTSEIMADATTNEAAEAINKAEKIMSVAQINAATSVSEIREVAQAVAEARIAFNKITDKDQLALETAKAAESKLLEYEAALRSKKASLGSPVAVKELIIAESPAKIRYKAGEKFDTTGMVVKLVFDDNSELVVTDYAIDKDKLSVEDDGVTVSYTYEGQTYSVKVLLNIEASTDPVTPVNPSDNGGCKSAVFGSFTDIALVIAAAVIIAIAAIKRKKA